MPICRSVYRWLKVTQRTDYITTNNGNTKKSDSVNDDGDVDQSTCSSAADAE